MRCSNEEIGKKVIEYRSKEYIESEEIELHLLECEYCWKKVQKMEKQKKLKRIENLIRSHVSKNAFEEIIKMQDKSSKRSNFSNKKETKKFVGIDTLITKVKSRETQVTFPEWRPILFELLKDGIKIGEIPLLSPTSSYSRELSGPGIYSINWQGKPAGWQKKLELGEKWEEARVSTLYSRASSIIEKIEIPNKKGTEKIEIIVSLERDINRVILSLRVKKD